MRDCVLVTGAAGGIGKALRPLLSTIAHKVRLTDIKPITRLSEDEEWVQCDLSEQRDVMAVVDGCDAVIHLGGISVESKWSNILNSNIVGTYNVYESVRKHGKPRVVYASSNHVTGFYPQSQRIGIKDPHRPDTLYGLSKCFGEDLARLYYDKFGIETLAVRIGSCFAEPLDERMLSTWFSVNDFASLIRSALDAPGLPFTIVYGVSKNSASWWDNADRLPFEWEPTDSADKWRGSFVRAANGGSDSDVFTYQGGRFAIGNHPDDASQ